jgi:hypothetical protein
MQRLCGCVVLPGGLDRDVDGRAERGEQALGQLGTAAARERRDVDIERDRARRQLGAGVAPAVHPGPEQLADRNRKQAGGGVRAVAHVLAEGESLRRFAPPGPDQPDRVDLEQHGRRTAFLRRLGIEDVGRSTGDLDRLRSRRVLVQQEPEIARGRVDSGQVGAKCQEHRWIRSRPASRTALNSPHLS